MNSYWIQELACFYQASANGRYVYNEPLKGSWWWCHRKQQPK